MYIYQLLYIFFIIFIEQMVDMTIRLYTYKQGQDIQKNRNVIYSM